MPSAPCIDCGRRPKFGGKHRCHVCQLRRAPIDAQVAAARRRLAMVPPELRRSRVKREAWPDGQRWCAGCQSFRDLDDFGKGATRCRPCASSAQHAANIEKVYGLTADEYEALLRLQGGKCAICRQRPVSRRLAVDHDHKTGAVRGLCCSRCNHDLLGSGFDSVDVLQAAVDYLTTPPATGRWSPPESKPRPSAARSGDEKPQTAKDTAPGFVVAQRPGSAPAAGVQRPALAAALERAASTAATEYPPLRAALDELDAAVASGKVGKIRDALENARSLGLLVAPPF